MNCNKCRYKNRPKDKFPCNKCKEQGCRPLTCDDCGITCDKKRIKPCKNFKYGFRRQSNQMPKESNQVLKYKLPFEPNQTLYWTYNGYVSEVWFKGIRQDKGCEAQIICGYIDNNLSFKENPICSISSFGTTIFDDRYKAEEYIRRNRKIENY